MTAPARSFAEGETQQDTGEADTMVLAVMNLPLALPELNSFTAHRKPWHRGQGQERKRVLRAIYWAVATIL